MQLRTIPLLTKGGSRVPGNGFGFGKKRAPVRVGFSNTALGSGTRVDYPRPPLLHTPPYPYQALGYSPYGVITLCKKHFKEQICRKIGHRHIDQPSESIVLVTVKGREAKIEPPKWWRAATAGKPV